MMRMMIMMIIIIMLIVIVKNQRVSDLGHKTVRSDFSRKEGFLLSSETNSK